MEKHWINQLNVKETGVKPSEKHKDTRSEIRHYDNFQFFL